MSRTRPPVDRLLYFTDAIVAIAATLLILPLVDEASVFFAGDDPPPTTEFLHDAWPSLLAFAISFVVIVRLWAVHHRLFGTVVAADGRLVSLDLMWAFTIVFLPLPTEITARSTDRAAIALYVGTMLVSSLVLLAIELHLRRTPELVASPPQIAPIVSVCLLFAAALLLGVLLTSYLPLLLLLLSGVLGHALAPRLDRSTVEA